MALKRGPTQHDIAHIIAETETKYKSETELTIDAPYLDLTGELGVSFINILVKIYRVITAPRCIASPSTTAFVREFEIITTAPINKT